MIKTINNLHAVENFVKKKKKNKLIKGQKDGRRQTDKIFLIPN